MMSFTVAIVILVLLALYVAPSIFAFQCKHPNRWPILLLNVLLGWMVWAWVGALIWACIPIKVKHREV